ncbi:MAG: outer membrane lipoprotein-sorting protein [Rhodothermales bacterium]
MKGLHRGILVLLMSCALFPAVRPAQAQEETALSIMQKSDDLTRGETQSGTYRMIIVRPDWERAMAFEYWSEGTDKAFIRVKEPVKERGVSFLKIKREMWQYVPRINRVIKIPPSMMLQSWMGSDFTNDDLVRESSIVDDYTHTLLGREEVAGDEAHKIELVPKPDAPVAWDRMLYWVRVGDYVPLRAESFNERGERIRTVLYTEIEEVGGRVIPLRMELIEDKKPGRKTILVLEDVRFDIPISRSVFTQQNLRRSR